jgi:septum formation protein
MREAGYSFKVRPSPAEEIHDASLPAGDLTTENARLKALAVSPSHPASTVIGADTLVFLDGDPLGKPADLEEARRMLQRLVGRTHHVCTGVCLTRSDPPSTVLFHELTAVTFKPLSLPEIDAYLDKIDPLDKAGAYAAQDHGSLIIETVEGSWTNVVGLPMERLARELPPFLADVAD